MVNATLDGTAISLACFKLKSYGSFAGLFCAAFVQIITLNQRAESGYSHSNDDYA